MYVLELDKKIYIKELNYKFQYQVTTVQTPVQKTVNRNVNSS